MVAQSGSAFSGTRTNIGGKRPFQHKATIRESNPYGYRDSVIPKGGNYDRFAKKDRFARSVVAKNVYLLQGEENLRDFGFAGINGRSSGSRPQPPNSGSVS